jgi:hypothetical protein
MLYNSPLGVCSTLFIGLASHTGKDCIPQLLEIIWSQRHGWDNTKPQNSQKNCEINLEGFQLYLGTQINECRDIFNNLKVFL